MARRIHLADHLSLAELEKRYRKAHDPVARSRWHMLWLLKQGYTATQIAQLTGYTAYWIGQIARRYNEQGEAGVLDRRRPGHPAHNTLLTSAQQEELRQVLAGLAPDGDEWTGRTVAEWLSTTLGRPVPYFTGWLYLCRLGLHRIRPRPRHVKADPAAQEAFKGGSAS
jgi:transposase